MPMLAHGETLIGGILLGILCYLALISLAIWTLCKSPDLKLRWAIILCAALVIVVSGVSEGFMLKDDSKAQGLGLDDVFGSLFWAFPFVIGVIALVRSRRAKFGDIAKGLEV
jgi:hypothetical protein